MGKEQYNIFFLNNKQNKNTDFILVFEIIFHFEEFLNNCFYLLKFFIFFLFFYFNFLGEFPFFFSHSFVLSLFLKFVEFFWIFIWFFNHFSFEFMAKVSYNRCHFCEKLVFLALYSFFDFEWQLWNSNKL